MRNEERSAFKERREREERREGRGRRGRREGRVSYGIVLEEFHFWRRRRRRRKKDLFSVTFEVRHLLDSVLRGDDPALEEEEVFLPALLLDLLNASLVFELLGPNELGQFILKLVNL